MKNLFFALILLMPFIAKAQSSGQFGYKSEDRYLYYSDVIKVDTGFTVNDLYKDAKLFITRLALTNTKITIDNPKDGLVAAEIEEPGTFKTETGIGDERMTLKYNIKLELKNGRYRYTFDNILVTFMDNDKRNIVHTLYDLDKQKRGGILGVGRSKRVLKAMDLLFLNKIDQLANVMKKKSDDF